MDLHEARRLPLYRHRPIAAVFSLDSQARGGLADYAKLIDGAFAKLATDSLRAL
jgi:hypothetical protein